MPARMAATIRELRPFVQQDDEYRVYQGGCNAMVMRELDSSTVIHL